MLDHVQNIKQVYDNLKIAQTYYDSLSSASKYASAGFKKHLDVAVAETGKTLDDIEGDVDLLDKMVGAVNKACEIDIDCRVLESLKVYTADYNQEVKDILELLK